MCVCVCVSALHGAVAEWRLHPAELCLLMRNMRQPQRTNTHTYIYVYVYLYSVNLNANWCTYIRAPHSNERAAPLCRPEHRRKRVEPKGSMGSADSVAAECAEDRATVSVFMPTRTHTCYICIHTYTTVNQRCASARKNYAVQSCCKRRHSPAFPHYTRCSLLIAWRFTFDATQLLARTGRVQGLGCEFAQHATCLPCG